MQFLRLCYDRVANGTVVADNYKKWKPGRSIKTAYIQNGDPQR